MNNLITGIIMAIVLGSMLAFSKLARLVLRESLLHPFTTTVLSIDLDEEAEQND